MMHAGKTVGSRTVGGAIWLVASRLTSRLIDFGTLLVLAKALAPSDFGLVSIAMTLILIIEAVFELPIAQSILRLDVITDEHLDTAFTISVARGLLLGSILLVLAVPFADIYADRRLAPLIIFLSLAPIARGAQSPAMVRFARQIDFRRDLIIELIGKIVGFCASSYVAYETHSYWAVAIGTVIAPTMMLVQSYILAPFKPRLSLNHWRSFVHFLGWTSAAQALGALSWQSEKLILGRLVTKSELGHFSMAADLAAVPEQVLVAPVMRPLMAGFVAIRDSPERLVAAYQRTSLMLLSLAAPAMVGISMTADVFVPMLLGGKWVSSISLLRWLAVAPIFAIWVAPLDPLAMALDRTSIFLRQRTIEVTLKFTVLFVLIKLYGAHGAVVGRLCTNIIMMLVTMGYVRRLIGVRIIVQLLSAWRIAFSTIGMVGTVTLVRHVAPPGIDLAGLFNLALAVLSGVLSYVTLMLLSWSAVGRPNGIEGMILGRASRIVGRLSARR